MHMFLTMSSAMRIWKKWWKPMMSGLKAERVFQKEEF